MYAGTAPSYQWYLNGNPVGTDTSAYSLVPSNDDVVYCVLTANVICGGTSNPSTSNSVHMIVYPIPVPSLNGPTVVCNSSDGNIYTTDESAYNINWQVTGGYVISGLWSPTVNVHWSTAGNQQISVKYTSSQGCNSADSTVLNVTVNPQPVPTLTGPTFVCEGSGNSTYVTDPGMSGYVWSVSPGGTIISGGTSTSDTIVVNWTSTGSQWINVSYTNTFGCTADSPTYISVGVSPSPVVALTISPTNAICAGMIDSFGVTDIVNGGSEQHFQWNVNGIDVGTDNLQYNYAPANGDVVKCFMTSNITCAANNPATSNIITMTVYPTDTVSITIHASDTVVCEGTEVTYIATTTGGGSSPTYEWHSGLGIVGTNSPVLNYTPVPGDIISCFLYSNANCPTIVPGFSNVIEMTVNPILQPVVAITASNTNPCEGWTVFFNAYPQNGGSSPFYQWNVNGVDVGTNSDQYSYVPDNGDMVYCIMTSSLPCLIGNPAFSSTTNIFVTPTVGTPTPITVIDGTEPTCQLTNGTTTTTYGSTASDATDLTWWVSDPADGYMEPTTGVMHWNNGIWGLFTINVQANGCNGPSAIVSRNVPVTPTVGTPDPITVSAGIEPLCQLTNGTTTTTYTSNALASTGLVWSISNPSAGTIDPVTAIMTWTNGFYGSVDIQVIANGCNGPSAMVTRTVNVSPSVGTPTPITVIAGTEPTCQLTNGTTTTTYGTTATNNTGFDWWISNPAAGYIDPSTGVMTWNNGVWGLITIYAEAYGCNGPTGPVSRTVSITRTVGTPTPITVISGTEPTCQLTNGTTTTTYSTTATDNTGFNWSINNPAAGIINAATGVMTWANGFSGTVIIQVTANGCNGPSAMVTRAVIVSPIPTPTVTGPVSVCINSTGNVYTTQASMSNYTWLVSAGGTITAGGGTGDNAVTITWNNTGTQTVSVNYTNAGGCTANSPTIYNVTVNAVPVPTITGQTNLCVNSGYYNYTTEPGMQNYSWVVSSGGTINYGSGTNQIQVSWIGAGAQTVSANYSNGVGCTAPAPTVLNVAVNPVPNQAGQITGTSSVCAGATGVAYSVALIPNATTYVWALPPDATIASGAGTNSITVDYADNASSGDIIVYGNNICGDGGNSPAFAVTVSPLPDPAGTITGPNNICEGTQGVVYSVGAITNATSYTWTVPTGVDIVSGNNTRSITVNFTPAATSGNITVAGTNSCGNGTVSNLFVTVNPIPSTPTVTNTGATLHSSAPAGNQWYFEGTIIVGATSQDYTATQSGHYWDIVNLNGCSSDTSNHKMIVITGLDSHAPVSINIYPVPNDGRFNVSFITPTEEIFSISVYNDLGVKIYEETKVDVNGTLRKVIDLRPVPDGVYTVIFEDSQNYVVKKVVVNK